MKKPLAAIAALFLMVPALPAEANYSRPGGTRQETCYTDIYREEYVPGTRERPGRVRRWTERKAVPCDNPNATHPAPPVNDQSFETDDNSCIEGAVLGGLVGAAGGAALSRGDGRWIGIPLGIVGGSMIGCQVDGG